MFEFIRRLRRRPQPPADWFTCPTCGAEVRVGALSCRSCGADDTTGWSQATDYDDLDLPEPDGPEIPDTFDQFERMTEPPRWWESFGRGRIFWVLLVAAMLFLFANAVLVRL